MLGSGSAFAGDCPSVYNSQQILTDLQTIQAALRAQDTVTFTPNAERLENSLGCMAVPVPPLVFASIYRYLGVLSYNRGDIEIARRWFRSSLELDPSYSWNEAELAMDNPLRGIFDEERNNLILDPVVVEGMQLIEAAGSSFVIDGRPLTEAAATTERFHVIQQIGTSDRGVRATWTIAGNDFPPNLLVASTEAATTSTEVAPVMAQPEVIKVERIRPPEKTPLIIAGIVTGAAAGGLYTGAWLTRGNLATANTSAELAAIQSTTNLLVMASGGVLLVGLGLESWGVLLDGGGLVFRF